MDQQEYAFMDATELADAIRTKRVSPVEAVDAYLSRIEALDPQLNAFLTVCADEAREAANEAEVAVTRGDGLPPLHGVPIGVKDLEDTKGIVTTYGSLVHRDNVPDQDSIAVERLRSAGAIILGKTNTPEFGSSGSTENKLRDHCRNPWDTTRTTGGSSGGSGAALAAGLCPLATGSDGGGSIRIPASFCGVYGIKPTHGRVPSPRTSWGLFGDSGPMSRTVRDSALMLNAIAGPDPRDSMRIREAPPDFLAGLQEGIEGLRVAWSPDLGYASVDSEVLSVTQSAAALFEEFGCNVDEAAPDTGSPFEMFETIIPAETYADDGESLLNDHSEKLMDYVRDGLERGCEITGAEYAKAMWNLWEFQGKMRDFFDLYDLLLTPTLAMPAFPVGRYVTRIGARDHNPAWDYSPFTPAFNMSGNPAASVPCGFSSDGLPIGLHIVGRLGDEVAVLRASAALEQARLWADKHPAIAQIG